jgi:toxin ParE1/3/4
MSTMNVSLPEALKELVDRQVSTRGSFSPGETVSPKPVVPRKAATRDAEDAVAWYLEEGAPGATRSFVDCLERAFGLLERFSGSGSPRVGVELRLEGLRSWRLRGFPHLVLYVEREDHVDVWRVLHGQRDLPPWLGEPLDD